MVRKYDLTKYEVIITIDYIIINVLEDVNTINDFSVIGC